MKPDLSEIDRSAIREGIRRKYAEVAVKGAASCFKVPHRPEGLVQLRYPEEILRELPDQILASSVGWATPSLGVHQSRGSRPGHRLRRWGG